MINPPYIKYRLYYKIIGVVPAIEEYVDLEKGHLDERETITKMIEAVQSRFRQKIVPLHVWRTTKQKIELPL